MTPLQTAQYLAIEWDWYVFPVIVSGANGKYSKKPLVEWRDLSSNDPGAIAAMPWDRANYVGVDCEKSKAWIIDVDKPEALALFPLPPTRIQETMRPGGRHYIYQAANFHQGIGTNVPVPGMDIRANGGFFVWYGVGLLCEEPLQPWPLTEPLGPKQKTEQRNSAAWDFSVPEGERNDTLYRELCRQRGKGWDVDELILYGLGWNQHFPKEPLSPAEVRQCAEQAFKHDPNEAVDSDVFLKGYFGTFAEFPEQEEPPLMVGHWLRHPRFTMIHSRAGKGKTAVVADMVYAMKTGGQWLGQDTRDPGKILWVNGDMSDWLVKKRLGYLGTMADLWHICFADLMTIPEQLMAICARYDLVIFDNRGCLFEVADINKAEAWKEPIDLMRRITQAGTAVILMTHSGKGEIASAMGSSSQEWFVDNILSIEQEKGSKRRSIKWEKTRDDDEPADLAFHLFHDGSRLMACLGHKDEDETPTVEPVESQVLKAVWDAHRAGEPLTERTIRELFRVANGPIHIGERAGRQLVARMIDAGKIGVINGFLVV